MIKQKQLLFFFFLLKSITVLSQASISPDDVKLCPPFEVSFHNTSKLPGPNIVYEWIFSGDTNFIFRGFEPTQVLKFTKPGEVLVELKAYDNSGGNNKMVDFALADVYAVGAHLESSEDSVCPRTKVVFDLNQSDSTFSLEYGDGSVSPINYMPFKTEEKIFDHVYKSVGKYVVKLKGRDQCGQYELTKTILVKDDVIPPSYFTIDSKDVYLDKELVIHPGFKAWEVKIAKWSFGDGSIYIDTIKHLYEDNQQIIQRLPDIKHKYTRKGIFTINLSTINHCGHSNSFTDTIYVCDLERTKINIYNKIVCPGNMVSMFTLPYPNRIKEWKLDDSISIVGSEASFSSEVLGNHIVATTFLDECGRTITVIDSFKVVNNIMPKAEFQFTSREICPGEIINFFNLDNNVKKLLWTFGDGTTSQQDQTSHRWSAMGKYPITLTVTNNCDLKSTVLDTVLVKNINKITNPFSTLFARNPVCPFSDVPFSLPQSTYIEYPNIKKISWNFGDGETSELSEVSHQYKNVGTYTPSIKITNYCGYDSTFFLSPVTVSNSLPSRISLAYFKIEVDTVCRESQVRFKANEGAFWLWDFGDGTISTLKNTTHKFSSPGKKKISLKSADGCGHERTYYDSVVVVDNYNKKIFNTASYPNPIKVCPNDSILLSSTWDGADTIIWDLGDGNKKTSNLPVLHAYKNAGIYKAIAKPLSYIGCANFIADTINIAVETNIKLPNILLDINLIPSSCQKVNFGILNNTGLSRYTSSFDFGDNTKLTSHEVIVPHTYSQTGNYALKVKVANGCNYATTLSDTVYIDEHCLGINMVQEVTEILDLKISPNPMKGEAMISYSLTKNAQVEISITNILGKQYFLHKSGNNSPGYYELHLDLSTAKLIPGLYFVKFTTGNRTAYKKIIVE